MHQAARLKNKEGSLIYMKLFMKPDFRSTQSTRAGLAQELVEGAGGPDPWIDSYI